MLYSEIIAVCSEIHTKHISTLCGQNIEFVRVKLGGPLGFKGLSTRTALPFTDVTLGSDTLQHSSCDGQQIAAQLQHLPETDNQVTFTKHSSQHNSQCRWPPTCSPSAVTAPGTAAKFGNNRHFPGTRSLKVHSIFGTEFHLTGNKSETLTRHSYGYET
jgi:hypothetical protein